MVYSGFGAWDLVVQNLFLGVITTATVVDDSQVGPATTFSWKLF